MPPYQSSSQDADFRDLIVITQASIMPWLPLLFHFKPGLDVGEGPARQSGQIIINLVTCLCMLGSFLSPQVSVMDDRTRSARVSSLRPNFLGE